MTKHRGINKTRTAFYRMARLLGDIQAALKGPGALLKRLLRKEVYKQAGKTINKVIK